MKIPRISITILTLLVVFLLGIDTRTSRADLPDIGTGNDDVIYFGYCSSCNAGEPGLQFCREKENGMDDWVLALDTGNLLIDGRAGNDHIEFVNQGKRCHADQCCSFEEHSPLPYSTIQIKGGLGDDCINGTPVSQQLDGNEGNDYLAGGNGRDVLRGGAGNDYLRGGGNDDNLYGQAGDDLLVGATGNDLIDGGSGDDTFRCRTRSRTLGLAFDWDDSNWATDCEDTRTRMGLEHIQTQNPYEDWAALGYCKNAVVSEQETTSNATLLLADRAAGASILLQAEGDLPLVGDFDSDGESDDVAVFRSISAEWFYDYNHNGKADTSEDDSDLIIRGWGSAADRPLAGDFDRDGRADDVAVFRASNNHWYFDYNHDGKRDPTTPPDRGTETSDETIDHAWGSAGDIPIAGDLDRDGLQDDIAVFKPNRGLWSFDYDHDGTSDHTVYRLGQSGDMPIIGDFDRDGFTDDLGLFRPSARMWFFFSFSSGRTVISGTGPWGNVDDIPVSGDFDHDGAQDDIGVFRLSTHQWYYDYHHNGERESDTTGRSGNQTSDELSGPWGEPGEPRAVTHKQYGNTCGPSSLNIVMEHLGWADRNVSAFGRRNLDNTGAFLIDLGYYLSTEHIMHECYQRYREIASRVVIPVTEKGRWEWPWQHGRDGFMDPNGVLTTTLAGFGIEFDIRYNIGNVIYTPTTGRTVGRPQLWMVNAPACGFQSNGNIDLGLPWVATHLTGGDAYPTTTALRSDHVADSDDALFDSFDHLQAVIKGYIDHNIPIVIGVESGGHFNTLIGYWQRSDGFYIYTADPLDGYGRDFNNQPMRWRKFKLDVNMLPGRAEMVTHMLLYGHDSGCGDGGWAQEIDETYRPVLCGARP